MTTDDEEEIRARIAGIGQVAADMAGKNAQAINAALEKLMGLKLTVEEFGGLLDEARAAWETTIWALFELRDAALVREQQ